MLMRVDATKILNFDVGLQVKLPGADKFTYWIPEQLYDFPNSKGATAFLGFCLDARKALDSNIIATKELDVEHNPVVGMSVGEVEHALSVQQPSVSPEGDPDIIRAGSACTPFLARINRRGNTYEIAHVGQLDVALDVMPRLFDFDTPQKTYWTLLRILPHTKLGHCEVWGYSKQSHMWIRLLGGLFSAKLMPKAVAKWAKKYTDLPIDIKDNYHFPPGCIENLPLLPRSTGSVVRNAQKALGGPFLAGSHVNGPKEYLQFSHASRLRGVVGYDATQVDGARGLLGRNKSSALSSTFSAIVFVLLHARIEKVQVWMWCGEKDKWQLVAGEGREAFPLSCHTPFGKSLEKAAKFTFS